MQTSFLSRVAGVLARLARAHGDSMWLPRGHSSRVDAYDLWDPAGLPRTERWTRCCSDLSSDFAFRR